MAERPQLRFESLHDHTKISDGALSHLEVLAAAERHGIGQIAFTDHDIIPDEAVLKQLRDYTGPVDWTVGLELSVRAPKLPDGTGGGPLHVLGFFLDLHDQTLAEHLGELKESRYERMQHFVKQLATLGFKITEDDVLKVADGSILGSPHFVRALELHPENDEVMKALLHRFRADAHHDERLKEKYDRMMQEGPIQYPYVTFMKASSYIPMPKAPGENKMKELADGVKLIRGAGGVAILAHWYFHIAFYDKPLLEKSLEAKQFDGLETAVVKYLREMVAKYDLFETMGMDSHSEDDMEAFVKSEVAELSVGQMGRLVERVKPDMTWTRLG
jgi:hypothetical protein